MPIYQTHSFWNYITNESETIINKVKDLLYIEKYNYETKDYETARYFQEVAKLQIEDSIYITLRVPAGLTKYLLDKTTLLLEKKEYPEKRYSENEILRVAEKIKQINPQFEIREYQTEAVLTSLNQFQSLIEASVGSGKTSVMSFVCKILENEKILILNDNNFILDQIYKRLLSFGLTSISWNPSKDPDYTKNIVILNTSGSDAKLNKQDQDYIKYLQNVHTIIYDEAQHVQSLTFFEPILYTDPEKLKHIIGYSGSPFRCYKHPYDDFDDFRTIAILGEPAFKYTMSDAIKDGNIAQPYGYFIRYNNKPGYVPEQFKDNYFMQYRANIIYNKNRNKAGLEMLKFLNKHNIKTLASFNNIKPGQNMMKMLKEEGISAIFSCGNETLYEWLPNKRGTLKLDVRKGNTDDIKIALQSGYNIIFGSQVLDEGVDISEFQAAVLFSAGKTPIAGIQRIGRASRKRKNELNVSLVIDFQDINGYYKFQEHYILRKQMMIDSGVKIFANVHDFISMVEQISSQNK
ncbi:MAG: DEAD/DEAH box helicase [Succinivibrionaceae bacterium]